MTGEDEREQRVITALRPGRRNARRIDVFIDGVTVTQLSDVVVAERGLRVGQALSRQELAELDAAERLARATDRALAFLSHRPRSAKEVRDRLLQRGIEDDLVDAVLARLASWGYVNDDTFAAYWIENRASHQPRGRRLIEQELRRKGVDREVVATALATTPLDEAGAAIDLARARAGRLAGLEAPARRQRLAGYLLRRGYEYATVKAALDAVLGGDDNEARSESLEGSDGAGIDSDSYAFDREGIAGST